MVVNRIRPPKIRLDIRRRLQSRQKWIALSSAQAADESVLSLAQCATSYKWAVASVAWCLDSHSLKWRFLSWNNHLLRPIRGQRKNASEKSTSFYYRATLCVSAVFAVSRCPSVRLSRWWIVSRWLKISLSRPSSPIILDFWPPAPLPNSKGNPFSAGAKYTGWKKFAIFDRNRHLSRKRFEMGRWLLWNVNRKS